MKGSTTAQKTITFDDLPAPEVELNLQYTYSFKPGKYDGLPENCYPDEEESEIILPVDFELTVMGLYIKSAREAIKAIRGRIMDFEIDDMPRKWAEEDAA